MERLIQDDETEHGGPSSPNHHEPSFEADPHAPRIKHESPVEQRLAKAGDH